MCVYVFMKMYMYGVVVFKRRFGFNKVLLVLAIEHNLVICELYSSFFPFCRI